MTWTAAGKGCARLPPAGRKRGKGKVEPSQLPRCSFADSAGDGRKDRTHARYINIKFHAELRRHSVVVLQRLTAVRNPEPRSFRCPCTPSPALEFWFQCLVLEAAAGGLDRCGKASGWVWSGIEGWELGIGGHMSERLCWWMAQVSLASWSSSLNSSSCVSNNSSCNNKWSSTSADPGAYSVDSSCTQTPGPEMVALQKLSAHIEGLLSPGDFDCSDAHILVDGAAVPVHRCILAARSSRFRELFFPADRAGKPREGKATYDLKEIVERGKVGCEAFMTVLSYLYSGKLKPASEGVCTCMDVACPHDACRPAIDFVVQLMYAAFAFRIPELVSLSQRRLLNFVEKAQVEDVMPILIVANACENDNDELLSRCIQRVARSDLDSVALEKELPREVIKEVNAFRMKLGSGGPGTIPPLDKNAQRIQRALDSDDVELVRLLLNEGRTTLDEANALHYAAAYCDSKIMTELLNLDLADVNLRNARGYTVLHIAAMRREPATIVALLTKGARPSDLTKDERTALQISKRSTRAVDYYRPTDEGKEAPKDRLCIDVLQQAESRNPLLHEVSYSIALAGDDLQSKLLYLENRVALAKILFPLEARVAMDIAHVDATLEFTGLGASNISLKNWSASVDLNETPSVTCRKLISRMEALTRTVELGKLFFPRCSDVLNKFMDDDLLELTCLEKGTPEEQKVKRRRFNELKNDISDAFNEDKAYIERSGMSSSSSCSSIRDGLRHKNAKKIVRLGSSAD